MTVITTGVLDGSTVARQEITTMMKNEELWTLYILALERLQAIKETDPLSWYQICGIHGRPYTEYDPPAGSKARPAGWGGYCTHSSILFPIWHRPYLALFEQALATHVVNIANEYTGVAQQRYLAAAKEFRIPYWDWARYPNPPDVVTKKLELTLTTPTGIRKLTSPLYQYTFHPNKGVREFGSSDPKEKKYEDWVSTLRCPSNDSPDATSQGFFIDESLNNQTSTIRGSTYNLLLGVTDYGVFSNNKYPGPRTPPPDFQSIELIHDGIHKTVGGSGHMFSPHFAAFDPLFMLHHANVDRIFALWQALHPKSYIGDVKSQHSRGGTFTTKDNELEDIHTHLTPFRLSESVYWTAAEARDTRTFHYTYPELAKWESLSEDEKAKSLHEDINTMYEKTIVANLRKGLSSNAEASVPLASRTAPSDLPVSEMTAMATDTPLASIVETQLDLPVPLVAQEILDPEKATGAPEHEPSIYIPPTSGATHTIQYNEWSANIIVEKFAAKTSFSIHVFLGDFDSDPAKWAHDKNLVGTYSIFAANIDTTGCVRCRTGAEAGLLVTGTIPLTEALCERLGEDKITALEPAEITPYLTKELHWRIETADNKPIERADIPSLKVSVAHVPVSVPIDITDLPTWGEHIVHPSITAGRPGGASEEN